MKFLDRFYNSLNIKEKIKISNIQILIILLYVIISFHYFIYELLEYQLLFTLFFIVLYFVFGVLLVREIINPLNDSTRTKRHTTNIKNYTTIKNVSKVQQEINNFSFNNERTINNNLSIENKTNNYSFNNEYHLRVNKEEDEELNGELPENIFRKNKYEEFKTKVKKLHFVKDDNTWIADKQYLAPLYLKLLNNGFLLDGISQQNFEIFASKFFNIEFKKGTISKHKKNFSIENNKKDVQYSPLEDFYINDLSIFGDI